MWGQVVLADSGAMDETTMQVTPTPPPQNPPRLLRRSSNDRVFGGVCGGLGRYWNVDPVVLRVVFGISLLVGGLGLFAYLAMWWLVPDESAPATARVNPSWVMVGLGSIAAGIAGLIGLGLLFSDGGSGVLLGALIAGVVIWIVLSQRQSKPMTTTAQSPVPEQGYAYGGAGDYTQTAVLSDTAQLPPAPPRQTSYLGLAGLCAAIAATGIALLVSDNPVVVLAAGLLSLGVTLVIGAFRGRARWLLFFAIPLFMIMTLVGQVQRLDVNTGESTWFPTAENTTYNLTAGTLDVDFSDWQGVPAAGDTVRIDVGVGEVRIAAPSNWDLIVWTDFGIPGSVEVGGDDGFTRTNGDGDRFRTVIPAATERADGSLEIDLFVQAGAVFVEPGAPAVGKTPESVGSPESTEKTTDNKKKEQAR